MGITLLLRILTIFATIQVSIYAYEMDEGLTQEEILKDRRRGIWGRRTEAPKRDNKIYEVTFTDKNKFSNQLYDELKEEKKEENFIIAPLGVNMLLSLLAFGAEGTTLQELQNALQIRTDASTLKQYNNLITELNNVRNVTLKVLNKLYISHDNDVKEDFQRLARIGYSSEIEQIEFVKTDVAAKKINDWVANNTNNKIQNLINPADLESNTKMVATNVIYFKGEWLNPFSEYDNSEQEFFAYGQNDTKHLVDMMFIEQNFKFGNLSDLKASFIEIPYKDNDIVMLVVLPHEIDGLKTVEDNLKLMGLKNLTAQGVHTDLSLFLPKFKVETSIDVAYLLKKMGINSIFNAAANFNRISDSKVYVSNFQQKVYIEVDEMGTAAAAATIANLVPLSLDSPPSFKIDRPFHYKIIKKMDDNEGKVLFAGNVYDIK